MMSSEMISHGLTILLIGAAFVHLGWCKAKTVDAGAIEVMSCSSEVGQAWNPYEDSIMWYKRDSDRKKSAIGQVNAIQTPFKETERFSITYEKDKDGHVGTYTSILTIKAISLVDNGTYICKITTNKIDVDYEVLQLNVNAKINGVTLIRGKEPIKNGNTFIMRDGKTEKVSCLVDGGNPRPTVQLLLGKKDITSSFDHEIRKNSDDGPIGLIQYSWVQTFSNLDFKPTPKLNGKHLACKAFGVNNKTARVETQVQYPPRTECEGERVVFDELYGPYTIECRVVANPPVDLRYFLWKVLKDGQEEFTVGHGEERDGYLADNQGGPTGTFARLTFQNLTEDNIRSYELHVRNSLGQVAKQIDLVLETPTTKVEVTEATPVPATPVGISGAVRHHSAMSLWALNFIPAFLLLAMYAV